MADQEKHVVRMLQRTLELGKSPIGSAPMCIPVTSEESFRSNTGPLIDVIVQRPSQDSSSAPLGSRDKVATPSQVHKGSKKNAVMPEGIGASGFYDKGGRWKKKLGSVIPYIPIMNPHAKVVRYWNQIFALSCLLAIFIDPLFFFLLSMDKPQAMPATATSKLGFDGGEPEHGTDGLGRVGGQGIDGGEPQTRTDGGGDPTMRTDAAGGKQPQSKNGSLVKKRKKDNESSHVPTIIKWLEMEPWRRKLRTLKMNQKMLAEPHVLFYVAAVQRDR